jgi:hypothetical protein
MGNTIGGWEGQAGAFYTGMGSSEGWTLGLSILICVFALWWGNRHESATYKK